MEKARATLRKNGSPTAATVTIPAGETHKTYTWSGEVDVAAGDLVDLRYLIAGATGIEYAWLLTCLEFQPS